MEPAKDCEEHETGIHSSHARSETAPKDAPEAGKERSIAESRESQESADLVIADERHVAEHLPEEPIFDGTEKVNCNHAEATVEEGTLKEQSRLGAFDFARGVTALDWPEKATALKNFVKERGVVMSNVLRRLSGKKEDLDPDASDGNAIGKKALSPTSLKNPAETGLDSSANSPKEGSNMKGRITLFTMSGCQDCRAARSLLRKKGLHFVEINVDFFPQRRLELEERTGTSSVPQLFFNESFIGGVDELKALDATGELNERLKEVFENECPDTAPLPPVYGEDEPQSGKLDQFAEVIRKLREKVQIKDHFYKMRMFNKCFLASEAVEILAEDQYCEREEAVEFGRKLVAKHFFRHVLQENIFEDGNHIYRFLEHDPIISTKCFNFNGVSNEMEPRLAAEVGTSLNKVALAIFESYVSEDGKHVDYQGISMSEEFRRYLKLTEDFHRLDLHPLTREEKLAFFINLYNMIVIHAVILLGHPSGPLERRRFFGDFQYVIGGYPFSLSAIENGVLRANQRPPYNLIKTFGPKDKRLPVALTEPEPHIHFALVCASLSSPAIRSYSANDVDLQLRSATSDFFQGGGVIIDSDTKTVSLSKIMKWYSVDFGKNELEILKWIVKHLEPSKAEELLQLLDGGHVKVVYQPYDWTPNF